MSNEELLSIFKEQLEQKLSLGEPDLQITYFQASKIFPGGPHSKSFDFNRVDFDALQQWADHNDWKVQTAPETTPDKYKDTPNIRFTKNLRDISCNACQFLPE